MFNNFYVFFIIQVSKIPLSGFHLHLFKTSLLFKSIPSSLLSLLSFSVSSLYLRLSHKAYLLTIKFIFDSFKVSKYFLKDNISGFLLNIIHIERNVEGCLESHHSGKSLQGGFLKRGWMSLIPPLPLMESLWNTCDTLLPWILYILKFLTSFSSITTSCALSTCVQITK